MEDESPTLRRFRRIERDWKNINMHFQREVVTFRNKWEKQNAMSFENSKIHFENLKKKKEPKLTLINTGWAPLPPSNLWNHTTMRSFFQFYAIMPKVTITIVIFSKKKKESKIKRLKHIWDKISWIAFLRLENVAL